MAISKTNNFDLIRLLAALQVLVTHTMEHMQFQSSSLKLLEHILSYIPGVPIFFTVSGFLIYASYDRNSDLKRYFRSRFLRIYPALWVCLIFTIILLAYFGFINSHNLFSKSFLAWLATQVTFFQFYTPDMFRAFGTRSPNGSLWTIPVEISFYVIVPIIFYLVRKLKTKRNFLLILLFILSVAYNYWYGQHYMQNGKSQTMLVKLMGLNLIPYLFYFLLGSLAYQNWHFIKKCYEGKGFIWLLIFIAYCCVFSVWLHKFYPNYFIDFYGFISIVVLSQTILALAYSSKELSKQVLNDNDISYGVYLYHMPIVNVFIQIGYRGHIIALVWVLLLTILLAFLSWRFVEKPMLQLKKQPLK